MADEMLVDLLDRPELVDRELVDLGQLVDLGVAVRAQEEDVVGEVALFDGQRSLTPGERSLVSAPTL